MGCFQTYFSSPNFPYFFNLTKFFIFNRQKLNSPLKTFSRLFWSLECNDSEPCPVNFLPFSYSLLLPKIKKTPKHFYTPIPTISILFLSLSLFLSTYLSSLGCELHLYFFLYLQEGRPVRIRGWRQHQQDLLPEPLPAGQAVPWPQDPLLRRWALPLLCSHAGDLSI